MGRVELSAALGAGLLLLVSTPDLVRATAPVFDYEIINTFPHDSTAFTQGLLLANGFFYEGTGIYGESSLRKVEVESGLVVKQHNLSAEYFGEGITALSDTIYQLTWTNHVAFTYVERDTFELVETLPYAWHGWGLADDGTHLIASDGTSTLRFLDPGNLEQLFQVEVHEDGILVDRLNELEYIQGRVYSNIWHSDRIAVIDPASGAVEAWLDLAGLRDSVASYPGADVLNGIAFDPEAIRLFVTGKRWPALFEIDVHPLHPQVVEEAVPQTPQGSLLLRPPTSPCRRQLRLSYQSAPADPALLLLIDASGRQVHRMLEPPGWGERTRVVELGGLPAGTYYLRLVVGHRTETRRVCVLR